MKEYINKEKKILEVISDIFIFTMLLIFPFIVDKTGFFNILECKWYSFVSIATTYVVINIMVILYYLFFKKVNIFKNKKFTIIQWLALSFLLVNTISCFISPFFKDYNLFIGVGRGEGLIVISLYTLTFIFASMFSKFKKRYINYFSITLVIMSLIEVLQYIGFNPFNMYQDGIGTHNVSFMGTIGNVDFISAFYCILLGVSVGSYLFLEDNKKWEKVLNIIAIFLGFFIIGIIDVQSGKVALFGTLVIIIPFIIMTNKRLSRFLIVLASFLMAYCTNVILNPEYHYDTEKLGLYFQFNYIVILFFIVCSALIYVAYLFNKKVKYDITNNKKVIKYFYLLIVFFAFLGLSILYFVNFKSGILYEAHELLHGNFDDDFGTYRIFLWKRTISLFSQYPIIGSGPDTFVIRFMDRYTNDIMAIGPLTLNDTAGNVYLTMLINIGIVGLINYLTFIFVQIKNGIKKMNSYSSVLLIAIICFLIQDFFNLWLVIVTPIFWLLLALHFSSINRKE